MALARRNNNLSTLPVQQLNKQVRTQEDVEGRRLIVFQMLLSERNLANLGCFDEG